MDKEQTKALAKEMIEAVRGFVDRALAPMSAKFSALEIRVAELFNRPAPKDGRDGQDADIKALEAFVHAEVHGAVTAAIAALPKPKDGIDGKSIELSSVVEAALPQLKEVATSACREAIGSLEVKIHTDLEQCQREIKVEIERAVAALPKPKDGRDGVDGIVGRDGRNGVDGQDGVSVSVEQVCDAIRPEMHSLLAEYVSNLPRPKDGVDGKPGAAGESVDRAAVLAMVREEVAKIPAPVNGKDGSDGRDAAMIMPHLSIDSERSYPRGVWASHDGGLLWASRATDPLKIVEGKVQHAGWVVITEGVSNIDIEQINERSFEVVATLSSGKRTAKQFKLPVIIYRNVWREGAYEQGDVVTWGGSSWHCQEPTTDKPDGSSRAWRLMVKHGSPGKDLRNEPAPAPRVPVRIK